MTAKQTTGSASSSGTMVDYVLRADGLKHSDEKVNVIFQNGCYGSHAEIKEQMKRAIELNKGQCKTPMFHAIFSLSENEHLTKEQEYALAEKLVKEFKLENSIVLGVKHASSQNKDHYHFVCCLPLIDGKAVPTLFQSKRRLMHISRACELDFSLKPLPEKNIRKEDLKFAIEKSLIGIQSFDTFEHTMNALGYSIIKGRGITFVDDKLVRTKGSSVDYSLQKIEKILAFNSGLNNHLPDNNRDFINQNAHDSTTDLNADTNENNNSNTSIIDKIINQLSKEMEGQKALTADIYPFWDKKKKKRNFRR